jgi:hypothetical protein
MEHIGAKLPAKRCELDQNTVNTEIAESDGSAQVAGLRTFHVYDLEIPSSTMEESQALSWKLEDLMVSHASLEEHRSRLKYSFRAASTFKPAAACELECRKCGDGGRR